jgi:ribosome biogenesis GTPase A
MTSARKKAAETMALTDVVIEVCDARLPEASSNPMIRELRLHRQRPCLKLLNKSDLADPAVTKSQMCIDLGPTMTITDTPGLMWPKIKHDSDGFMLAASHAIGRNAVIDSEVAIFLAGLLLQHYPAMLTERYGIALDGTDGVGVVEAVAKKRGCIIKGRHGGELDLEKAGMILLTDYRGGKLGRISLESPDSRAAMLMASEAAITNPVPG